MQHELSWGPVNILTTPDRSFSSSQPFTQDSNLQLEAGEGAIGQQRHLPLVFVVAPFVRVDCTDRATAQLICCYNSPCHTPLENFHGWLLNRKKFARKNKSKSGKSSEKHSTDPWLRGRQSPFNFPGWIWWGLYWANRGAVPFPRSNVRWFGWFRKHLGGKK